MTPARYTSLLLAVLALPLFGADNPLVGTWRINPQLTVLEGAASRAIRQGVVTYQLDAAGRFHKTLEGMDAHGHHVRNENVIDVSGCNGQEHPLESVITVEGQRIEFQGQVPEQGNDLLSGHYPFAPAGAFVTTSCTMNRGSLTLTTLIRRKGKLIKPARLAFPLMESSLRKSRGIRAAMVHRAGSSAGQSRFGRSKVRPQGNCDRQICGDFRAGRE